MTEIDQAAAASGSPSGARPAPRFRLAKPILGPEEEAAVAEVLRSGHLTNGPAVTRFEDVFARRHGVEHAVAMANGTVALAAIYLGLDLGPGDEIIVPSLTFISTATSVLHVGATPVFAEVDPHTFNLDPADVARRVTPRTKAIVAVHYGGQSADMDELRTVADDAGAFLIEDAAEAHGASYKGRPVGSLATAGMFSFTPTKNITTGEGGMVTTDDGALAARLRLLRSHGQSALYVHDSLGFNWRLSDIQAAVGAVQVGKLDAILATKRANADHFGKLLAALPGITPPVVGPDRDHAYMLYTTLVPGRGPAVIAALGDLGVEARLYFPPAHRQPVFAGTPVADLPVTDHLAASMVSLPFHAKLTFDELTELASVVGEALDRTA